MRGGQAVLSNFNLQPMRQFRSRGNRRSRKEFYIPIPAQKFDTQPDRKPVPKRKANFKRKLLENFIGGLGFAGGLLTVMLIVLYLFKDVLR